MIAVLTIGKRRAGTPSESGSMTLRSRKPISGASGKSRSRCGRSPVRLTRMRTSRTGSGLSPIRGAVALREAQVVNRTTEVVKMSTIVQQAEQFAGEQLKRMRWALGLSGAVSILFGIVILVWPDISLYALVLLFGAFALVRGIFGLVAAVGGDVKQGRGWLVVSSLAGIVVGVLVFFWTDMSALALLYVIGAYAITL